MALAQMKSGGSSVRGCDSLLEIIRKFDQEKGGSPIGGGKKFQEVWFKRQQQQHTMDLGDNRGLDERGGEALGAPAYEEMSSSTIDHLQPQRQQQLYKNDKNFTLSVRELQFFTERSELRPAVATTDDDENDTELDAEDTDGDAERGKGLAVLPASNRFAKLHFDIVTVGTRRKKRKERKRKADATGWSKSKTLFLMWAFVALFLWVITYMILRLVYVI